MSRLSLTVKAFGSSAVLAVALPPQPTQALPAEVCGENGSAKDHCLRTMPPA